MAVKMSYFARVLASCPINLLLSYSYRPVRFHPCPLSDVFTCLPRLVVPFNIFYKIFFAALGDHEI